MIRTYNPLHLRIDDHIHHHKMSLLVQLWLIVDFAAVAMIVYAMIVERLARKIVSFVDVAR